MTQPKKQENLLVNIVCNIAVPTVVLMKFSSDKYLGALWGLVVALAFPIGYGVYDLIARRKTNLLSVLGFVSVLLSGTFTLLKLGGVWFAAKDAVLPTMIGLMVLTTLRTKHPLVKELFYNDQILDTPRIDAALAERGTVTAFEARLRRASIVLALTFICTAPVSFLLVKLILKSAPGTVEFNAELGRVHWVLPLVISVPSVGVMMTVLWKLIKELEELTGLTQDEILRSEKPKEHSDPVEK